MKKLIIFDMDGTLVDSSLTLANSINHVRQNLSLEPMNKEEILEKINDPHINPALHLYDAQTFTPEHEEWFSEYYTQNHEKELSLYEGIEALLLELKTQGFKIAVATNAYRVSTLQSLGHLKIFNHFDTVVCYDDVAHGKPQPDMLQKILQDLNISIQETLFVGDCTRDQLAAQALQMDYLMVNWGFSNHEDALHNVTDLRRTILEY